MFKPSNTGRYTVKPHNPIVQWIVRALTLVALAALLWGVYEYGQVRGGYNRAAAQNEIENLTRQISSLNARINELTVENAQLASDSAIDSTATQQVRTRLRELNDEILELKEELVFYRSLLSPADLEPGLQVLGMQLMSGASEQVYSYKIVLTQRRNRNRYAGGTVDVVVNGTQDDETVQLTGEQVLLGDNKELEFRFKNFQSLEGQMSLPPGFDPQEVLVTVNPKDRSLKKVERNYDWNSIVTGG